MIREDHLLINYKLLAIEVLSKALDDLCPKYVEVDSNADSLTKLAAERCARMCGVIHKGQVQYVIDKYDSQWDELLTQYLTKKVSLEKDKRTAISSIFRADNTSKIDTKLIQAEDAWDRRRKKLEDKIRARRRGFITRVESQSGQKYTPEEVRDLKVGLEAQISREIRDFERRRDLAVQKIIASRNSFRIIERMTEKEVIFDTKIKGVEKSFKRQEEIYNRQWGDEDIFGASLHWFINDISQVKFWCQLAGVPLPVCYHTVKARLELIEFDSPEIDGIIAKLKSGELSETTIPELTISQS
jgi:hypothetical protein